VGGVGYYLASGLWLDRRRAEERDMDEYNDMVDIHVK